MSAIEFYHSNGHDEEPHTSEANALAAALDSVSCVIEDGEIEDEAERIEYGVKIAFRRCFIEEREPETEEEREHLVDIGADETRWVTGVSLAEVTPTKEELAIVRAWLERWEAVQ